MVAREPLLITILTWICRLVAHWIRKAKRKVRRQFRGRGELEGNIIDLSAVRADGRGELDQIRLEHEITSGSSSKRTSTGLTCPQILALGGAIGALPQVALGNANLVGLPDWKELSNSLRKARPFSLSAPILTVTSAPGSPNSILAADRRSPQGPTKDNEDDERHNHHHQHKSHDSSGSDLFSVSHRDSKELGPIRAHVRKLVESKPFQQGILCAILINTLSMGVEYHAQVRFSALQKVIYNNSTAAPDLSAFHPKNQALFISCQEILYYRLRRRLSDGPMLTNKEMHLHE